MSGTVRIVHLPRTDLAEIWRVPSLWRRLCGQRPSMRLAERTSGGWIYLSREGGQVTDREELLELDRARREAIRQHDK